MKLFGFEIRRAPPGAEQRNYQQMANNFRRAANFTAGPGLSMANPAAAMGVPAIFLCVSKIDKTIATLPKLIYDATDPERPAQVFGTPLGAAVGRKPNGWQNGFNFWTLVSNRKLLWGNFYAEIQRDARTDECIGLWPLLSQDCIPDIQGGKKIFRVGGRVVPDEDIFHVMGHSWNGIQGMSIVALHRSTIEASASVQSFVEGFYRNGVRLSGFIKHPDKITDPAAAARLREDIRELWQGGENAGNVGLLEEGMDWVPFSMPLKDAQFVETQKMQVAQAARIFDMPLHKLAETEGQKFNNVEQGNISYVIDCIEPHLGQIIQEANNKLFAPRDIGRLELRIPTEELLQGDLLSRLQALGVARQWGIMTINEARKVVGLPSIGAAGDQTFVPGNGNLSMSKDAVAPQDKKDS
jgi:HK97 family phage portal protein